MQFFGDSFDVVKRFLLQTIEPDAAWVAFPMFTDRATAASVRAFESFLGVNVVGAALFTESTNRADHFTALARHRNVFLDPDTGIKLKKAKGAESVKYVFASELVALCQESPERLLVVFDQSVPRGSEKSAIQQKLRHFSDAGLHGFAYLSHACFVTLSATKDRCRMARANLLASGLPQTRVI